jgi:hypothetical protein
MVVDDLVFSVVIFVCWLQWWFGGGFLEVVVVAWSWWWC